MRTRRTLMVCVLGGALALGGTIASNGQPPPPGDIGGPGAREQEGGSEHAVYAWYLGVPVLSDYVQPMFLGGTGPDRPVKDVPDLNLYLIGPPTKKGLASPPRNLPSPPFPPDANVLPPHHNTVDEFVASRGKRHDAIGYWVVPGPKGKVGKNVRVRREPARSIPGAPLAYQITIGTEWVPLTSHLAIEYGLSTRQLKRIRWDEGFGGQNWSTFGDKSMQDAGVRVTRERGVHLRPGPR